MGYYTCEQVTRLVHEGAIKCRLNIGLSRNEKELDCAINMCNEYSRSIVSILNNEDHRFIASKLNIHRKWCQRAFDALQAVVTDLDNYISECKENIAGSSVSDGKIGFNA